MALPKTTIDGKTYYVDQASRQLRNVENPEDCIDIDDDREMRHAVMHSHP